MITRDEAITKFKEILAEKSSWKILAKSQFINHLAVFMSWCLRSALWAVERARQEFFLSTALNDSTVLSFVEDREYIPRRRTYSSGTGTITNEGTSSVTLPIYTAFKSETEVDYVTAAPLVIAAGETASVEFRQMSQEIIETEVAERQSFLEILIDKDITAQINSIAVYVDETGEDGYAEWEYRRLFQNSDVDEKIYDVFYTHNGQTGIRFGNEYIGTILSLGAKVKIELWLTDGDTTLAEGQSLFPVGEILDSLGAAASLTVVTTSAITGGEAEETTEEMRTNLRYWPIYNEKLVWEDDYVFFVKRAISGILWIKVWGEEEAEAAYGSNVLYINKVFISAYANRTGLETEIMERLDEVSVLNRKFEWVEPTLSTFDVSITGKVARTKTISEVQSDITTALIAAYGKDSNTRKSEVHKKDLYAVVNETDHFSDSGAYFEISLSGTVTATDLNEMVHINESGITISLSYLS